MEIINLRVDRLRPAEWNPNRMEPISMARLKESIRRFGVVSNLVVRPLSDGEFEVLSGNHRLGLLKESGEATAPCVVVDLGDAQARLLAQALNRIQGDDDLGLRAELVRDVLKELGQEEVLSLLPESAESLAALSSLGQEDMAEYLRAFEGSQAARLKHFNAQLTPEQQEVVEKVLSRFNNQAQERLRENPNIRGASIFLLCLDYLERNHTENE
ncbi:MAG: ParB N-terminal domain-containing protein [SAR202 cluster bacterium]|nr:ParB N-terminal domain-containing protein [SAR202 cluster bacterium]